MVSLLSIGRLPLSIYTLFSRVYTTCCLYLGNFVSSNRRATLATICCRQHVACCRQHSVWCKCGFRLYCSIPVFNLSYCLDYTFINDDFGTRACVHSLIYIRLIKADKTRVIITIVKHIQKEITSS